MLIVHKMLPRFGNRVYAAGSKPFSIGHLVSSGHRPQRVLEIPNLGALSKRAFAFVPAVLQASSVGYFTIPRLLVLSVGWVLWQTGTESRKDRPGHKAGKTAARSTVDNLLFHGRVASAGSVRCFRKRKSQNSLSGLGSLAQRRSPTMRCYRLKTNFVRTSALKNTTARPTLKRHLFW